MSAPSSADLTVDTALLTGAGNRLEDAAGSLSAAAADPGPCPLAVDALGPDAIGREVLDAAGRRVRQAAESAALMAHRLLAAAGALRTTATGFRAADDGVRRQPR